MWPAYGRCVAPVVFWALPTVGALVLVARQGEKIDSRWSSKLAPEPQWFPDSIANDWETKQNLWRQRHRGRADEWAAALGGVMGDDGVAGGDTVFWKNLSDSKPRFDGSFWRAVCNGTYKEAVREWHSRSLVLEEGNELATFDLPLADCKQKCEENAQCHSIAHAEGHHPACHLKEKELSASEAAKADSDNAWQYKSYYLEVVLPVFSMPDERAFTGQEICALQAEGAAADLPLHGSAYTIEAWVLPDADMGSGRIVSWGEQVVGKRQMFRFAASPADLINTWWENDLSTNHAFTTLADGVYHHVAATWDGVTRRVIVDFGVVAEQQINGYKASNKADFCLGDQFKGKMKGVKIWKVARSAEELHRDEAPPLEWWDVKKSQTCPGKELLPGEYSDEADAKQNCGNQCESVVDVGCKRLKFRLCKVGSLHETATDGTCLRMRVPNHRAPDGKPRGPMEREFWKGFCKKENVGFRLLFRDKLCAKGKVLAGAWSEGRCAELAAEDAGCSEIFDFEASATPQCRCLEKGAACEAPANINTLGPDRNVFIRVTSPAAGTPAVGR